MSHRRTTGERRGPTRLHKQQRALRTLREQRDDVLESACDALATRLGWRIYRYEQGRKTRTDTVTDRLYTHRGRGLGIWFDFKRTDDRLSRAQATFLLDQLAAGHPAACGDLDVLTALLQCRDRFSLMRRSTDVTHLAIAECARRFRGETLAEAAAAPAP
jgi:hypothetical protein